MLLQRLRRSARSDWSARWVSGMRKVLLVLVLVLLLLLLTLTNIAAA